MNSSACRYPGNCVSGTVVGGGPTFLSEEATGQKNLVAALAGFDKTYTINLAGHASTADNDDAADFADFWNDAESAKSDRYYDQSSAWADFRSAGYADQATAVGTEYVDLVARTTLADVTSPSPW